MTDYTLRLWSSGEETRVLLSVLPVTPANFGPLGSSLPILTANLTAKSAMPIIGTIASSLPILNTDLLITDGLGDTLGSDTDDLQLDSPSFGLVGAVNSTPITATMASTLPTLTCIASGINARAITGTVAQSLNAVTCQLLGSQTAPGAIAGHIVRALNPVTCLMAGATVRGALAATLPAMTGALTGGASSVPVVGTMGSSLSPLSGALNGTTGTLPTSTPPGQRRGGGWRRRFQPTIKASGPISKR